MRAHVLCLLINKERKEQQKSNKNATQMEHWNQNGTQMEHRWNNWNQNGTQMEHKCKIIQHCFLK